MAAILLMSAEQVRARPGDWLERRRRTPEGAWCVTASEMAKVCGIAPRSYGGPYRLYWDKLMGRETEDRDEMRRGRALEPVVLGEFADDHPGLHVLPGGMYCRSEEPWLVATLDGQAIEADTLVTYGLHGEHAPRRGDRRLPEERALAEMDPAEIMVVEAKTAIPMDAWGFEEDTAQVPDHIRAQVLIQAHVRGAQLAFVAVKPIATWARTKTFVIEIGAQEKAEIEWMIASAREFTTRLERGEPPPVDWYPATTEVLRKRYPGSDIDPELRAEIPIRLARRYRALGVAMDILKRRRGLVQNEMLDRAGNAGEIWARDGGRRVKVATRTSGPMPEIKIPAKERVDRLNRAGWARQPKERER